MAKDTVEYVDIHEFDWFYKDDHHIGGNMGNGIPEHKLPVETLFNGLQFKTPNYDNQRESNSAPSINN